MRRTLVVLHRWLGLTSALFLSIAGLTGAVIGWADELDSMLNPELFRAASGDAPARPSLELAGQLEAADPRLSVRYLPLAVESGRTLIARVEPRIDPRTGQPFALGFDQVALDPSTGAVQGERLWGALSLRRQNFLPFLYRLHYSLHLPTTARADFGILFMGIVALMWTLDAFIALWISFPSRKAWRKSFAFRVRAGGYRLIFDLHRSGGVWVWPLLLALGVSAVSMNLGGEVVRPIVSLFSPLTPQPFDGEPEPSAARSAPAIDRARAIEIAEREARRRGVAEPLGGMLYASERRLYGVGFFAVGGEYRSGGLGGAWVYLDAEDGRLRGATLPGEGSAGDVFMQAQFPLHSGRLAGIPGRVAISLLGLVVALLSVTGVVIWAKKRRARSSTRSRAMVDVGANAS